MTWNELPHAHPAVRAAQVTEELAAFMHTTQALTQRQLTIYDAADFLSEDGREAFERAMSICTDQNVAVAREAIHTVNMLGYRVQVKHLGATGLLDALDFDTAARSYSVGVRWPGPQRSDLRFSSDLQLHIQ